MMIYLLIAAGGFLGAIARFTMSTIFRKKVMTVFPFDTFIINVVGSFVLGLLMSYKSHVLYYSFFGIGFLGAYTTFSTFQLETVQLFKNKNILLGLIYMMMTCVGGIVFAYLGFIVGKVK